jgi:hypothetical protein
MIVKAYVNITAPAAAVWNVITDIENATQTISGIELIEVLEKPENGLVGLQWRETRTVFGKTATEVMQITDAAENDSYTTKAVSHGCVYITTMEISANNEGCALTMTHEIQPQAFVAKLLSFPMGLLFKGTIRRVILQDLNDIKNAVEHQADARSA